MNNPLEGTNKNLQSWYELHKSNFDNIELNEDAITSVDLMCEFLTDLWESNRDLEIAIEALQKIEDPRLIGHTEPDAYTAKCCLMNIAHEALIKIGVSDA